MWYMYDGAELCHVLKVISFKMYQIDHFTGVCSMTWPLNGSEADGDLALIKTSLLFFCASQVVLMLTGWQKERSVLKQGHLQARL